MGFMECAVVVYLRKIYYPDGFSFPLVPIQNNIGITELLREIATIIMLLSIGFIAGKTKVQRFSFFIFCFAIWDIFYYVFLKLLIGWPLTLADWDILFLIPVPWIGPVSVPCILSLTMILYAIILTTAEQRIQKLKINKSDWLMMSAGSIIIVLTFIYDYLRIAFSPGVFMSQEELLLRMSNYIPEHYNWWMFLTGESIFLITLFLILNRNALLKRQPLLAGIHANAGTNPPIHEEQQRIINSISN